MKIRTAIAAAAIGLLALSGCGTTDDAKSAGDSTTGAAAGGPVSITDSRGKEVKLDHPAQKVVALEWSVAEYAQSLGVNPAGVADPKGYAMWDKTVPLQGDPKDVGVRNEPSVDSIAGLEPDVILADTASIPAKQMAQMEKIAPVAVFTSANTSDLVRLVKDNQDKVGTLLGKEDEAKRLGEEYDQQIAEAKKKVADAGKEGTPFVFAYPYEDANALSIRMHGPGSAPSAIGKGLGLKDAWTKKGDAEYGVGQSDVEGLTALPADARFFYWKDPEAKDPIEGLSSNRVWKNLGFVKAGNVHRMDAGVWLYGGTKSMAKYGSDLADAIAG
ncbi:iron-siderophore ABC transporter substrate-binding protein [Brevibacterium sp. BRM-1]|uniref:ABC transporter substrate-binding protein n=1 Tax=Brevibacterium sp. BRM-1 TaxID=2999062 RepID=UPI0022803A4C|nr:iron-siderophore ABC transporter substrate-binding protein [Brevibacterium sp. BRM-1]WAL39382.1 iron-siderophore ABC transporter substrate-binding protein [Brevibacterium sp. BRM-1]